VYFIATRLLRDDGRGPTLLVSPLLALMRNQIDMATRIGVNAATINSANRGDWDAIKDRIRANEVDLLLISPERLNNPEFREEVLPEVVATTGLLVVDEAHCISDWGHDFRPDYRRIQRVIGELPEGVPVLCTTATANDRVVDDVVAQLGRGILVLRGTLDRESLVLQRAPQAHPAERMAWLVEALGELEGTGIIYCLTVADTVRVADWLEQNGVSAHAYSGDTDAELRERIERDLLDNRVKVVVATSALGMGFDKPDLAFVIHYQSPGSAIGYYQQVGRAGRALERSHGILLQGGEDEQIQDYFIRTAFPPRDQAEHVIGLLEASDSPVSVPALMAEVNVRKTRLEAMLKVLEVDGAVERAGRGWQRTTEPWTYDDERVERVTAARRTEQAAMREYGRTQDCLMQFLRRQLDDPGAEPCGRCMNCTGTPLELTPDPGLVARAQEFLRNRELTIQPRLQWPTGLADRKGRIPEELRIEPGRALCIEHDGGWGQLVDAGRAQGRFSDELVAASARLIRRWNPTPAWLTCVPSQHHVDLVREFAKQVAQELGIEFRPLVAPTRPHPPQREMENSTQQLTNVLDAFTIRGEIPPGPVLLVDDTVDSRWTLTVVGATLREAGSGSVHPFVLADAAGG
jgi:ATP-dependent DNA helicase RecQ